MVKLGAGQVGRRGRLDLSRGEEKKRWGETWSSWLLLSVFESRGWLATTGPAEHNIGGQQHTYACDFYCPRLRSRGGGERRTTRRPSRTAEGAKAAWSASESKFRGAARGVQAHRYCDRIYGLRLLNVMNEVRGQFAFLDTQDQVLIRAILSVLPYCPPCVVSSAEPKVNGGRRTMLSSTLQADSQTFS